MRQASTCAAPNSILLRRVPPDRGRIEQNVGAQQARDASRLRIPLIPTDEHTDSCVSGLPDAEPHGAARHRALLVLGRVAWREIVLLVEQRVVGNVHLPIDAQQSPVGVDHGGRVSVETRRLPLEQRHDQHDGELTGESLHHRRGRSGDRLGQVEALAALSLTEVERVEELLEADDPRATRRRLTNLGHRITQIGVGVSGDSALNETHGKGAVHTLQS